MMIKTIFILVIMIACLILALITKDAVNSQLLVSIGIIIGAFAFKFLAGDSKVKN